MSIHRFEHATGSGSEDYLASRRSTLPIRHSTPEIPAAMSREASHLPVVPIQYHDQQRFDKDQRHENADRDTD